jgi:hypothetical protein
MGPTPITAGRRFADAAFEAAIFVGDLLGRRSRLRIGDPYRTQVMLTESCEPSSPSIRGRSSFAKP